MTAPACGWVRAIDGSTCWVRAIDDSTCMLAG